MNERIKELVVTAELSTDTEVPEFLDDFLEKFAELIVRECGNFTDPVTRKLMMKHFGVE